MLRRVLADHQAENGRAGPDGEPSYPVALDPDERRLNLFVAAIAITVVVAVLIVTLTKLPGLGGSADPSTLQGPPAGSWAGDVPAVGDTGPARSTPPGSVATPAGGPGVPGDAAAPTAGEAVAPPGEATAAPGGTAGKTTVPAGTAGPGATAGPVPTTNLPPDIRSALADLSAAIRWQVDAGQLDPVAGDDLMSKVHQVAREVSEGNWGAARYYAGRIRDKLGKYRDDGLLTASGYQAMITRLDVLDEALS